MLDMYSAVFYGSQLAEQRLGTAPAPPSGKKFHQDSKVHFFVIWALASSEKNLKVKRIATSDQEI